jgi:hypothetical protein
MRKHRQSALDTATFVKIVAISSEIVRAKALEIQLMTESNRRFILTVRDDEPAIQLTTIQSRSLVQEVAITYTDSNSFEEH